MTARNQAANAMIAQIDDSIRAIQHSRGSAKCEAHASLADGVVTLLRCERERITEGTASVQAVLACAATAGAFVAGVVQVIVLMAS